MDSFLKLKSEFDNLVSKIKIPGQEGVSYLFVSYVIHFFSLLLALSFFSEGKAQHEGNCEWRRQAQKELKIQLLIFKFFVD
jgi:hypothetical protein